MKKEKDIKKYYKKIELIYTVYDSKNKDLPIAQFDSLKELYNYVNKFHKIGYGSLKNAISKLYYIMDRYYIIKDNLNEI